MDDKQKRLGELLMEKGLIGPEQLENALDEQKRTREFLGKILLKRGQVKEKDLLGVLSQQFGIPFVSIRYKYIDWDFVKRFSPSLILDYKCLPFKEDDYSVTVAITNPLDAWVLKKAEEETRGFRLKLVLVSEGDMEEAIRRYEENVQNKSL